MNGAAFMATFLFSVAIQEKSDLNQGNLAEFLDLFNNNKEVQQYTEIHYRDILKHDKYVLRYLKQNNISTHFHHDLAKRKRSTNWNVDELSQWIFATEFDDLKGYSVHSAPANYSDLDGILQDALDEIVSVDLIRDIDLESPAVPMRNVASVDSNALYNSQYQLIFRALFIPVQRDEAIEASLEYTKNMQSFSLSTFGMCSVMSVHCQIKQEFLDPTKYKIMVVVAPLKLIGWKKLCPMKFAYDHITPTVGLIEKEVVLPPFTRYKFLRLRCLNRMVGAVGINHVRKDADALSIGVLNEVIQHWNGGSADCGVSVHHLQYKLAQIIVGMNALFAKHERQFRFMDVANSDISEWQDWYNIVLANK